MANTDELEVPMAWFWAQHAAEDLITRMGTPLPPATFEFQATREVLALTLLFTGIANRAHELSLDQMELIRDLVFSGGPWLGWCASRLDAADTTARNLRLANLAWEWLLLAIPPSIG